MFSRDYVSLDSSYNYGGVEGYVVDTEKENLENWMTEKGFSQESLTLIRNTTKRVAIIRSIFVEEDERGQGFGTDLLEEAIDKAGRQVVDAILLEADTGESNNFDLIAWYEQYGFSVIERPDQYPLMMKIM